MKRNLLTSVDVVEIRERVKLEASDCKRADMLWDTYNDLNLRQIYFLIVTYVTLADAFGIAPYGDMLPHLGWPGRVLHELFCQSAAMWDAFRKLVERSHNLPWRTSLTEGDVVLHSVPQRFVYREIVAISGVTCVELYPIVPAGSGRMNADFLVRASTGMAVYVEVAMVSSQADAEQPILEEYRKDLQRRVRLYERAGIDAVIIWSDQAASPRVLAERINDLRARLDLPTRPPAPLAWYEEID